MSDLWVPLAEESIAYEMSDNDLPVLERLWRKALSEIGLEPSSNEGFFEIREGATYFNSTLLSRTLVSGANSWKRFIGLLRLTYRVDRFLAATQETRSPEDRRVRSLALGICQQALLARLPAHDDMLLAQWLMNPDSSPRLARRTIQRLLRIQKERNTISATWKDFFGNRDILPSRAASPSVQETVWRGLPVFPGNVEAEYLIDPTAPPERKAILVFSRAMPETVTQFPIAKALVFARGGLLCHACSVAREQRIPCVTGVGDEFIAAVKSRNPRRLALESGSGTVCFVEPQH